MSWNANRMAHARPVFEVRLGEAVALDGLLCRQRGVVLEPEIAAALEFWPALHFGAAHLVDGVAGDQLHDVEAVEGDLGFREVFGDARDVGGAHVDADLLDAAGVRVVLVDMVRELLDRLGATAFGNVDDAGASMSTNSVM